MTKAEIIAELPRLSPTDLAEVQAKVDDLLVENWSDNGELSNEDKAALRVAIREYRENPTAGESWESVKAEMEARFRK